jgi:hypothetical protein
MEPHIAAAAKPLNVMRRAVDMTLLAILNAAPYDALFKGQPSARKNTTDQETGLAVKLFLSKSAVHQ